MKPVVSVRSSGASLTTPYNANFVRDLKAGLTSRRWDPDAKVWKVSIQEAEKAARLVLSYFPDAVIEDQRAGSPLVQILNGKTVEDVKVKAVGADDIAKVITAAGDLGISLYHHQAEAIARLESGSGLLQMEMGTGKTRTALTFWALHRSEYERILVVAPAGLIDTWRAEVVKVFGENAPKVGYLKNGKIKGDGVESDILLTGVELYSRPNAALVSILDAAKAAGFLLVVDESTTIKTHDASRTVKVLEVASLAKKTICMTGTIITRQVNDIFSQVKACSSIWDGYRYYSWVRAYCETEPNRWGGLEVKGPKDAQALNTELDKIRFIARRDHCLELPGYQDEWIEVETTKAQNDMLDDLRKTLQSMTTTADGKTVKVDVKAVSSVWTKARQIVGGAVYGEGGSVIEVESKKVALLSDLIEDASERIVVFCEFAHEVDRILALVGKRGYSIDQIEKWRSDNTGVLVMTTAAGGYGLNLQEAAVMIFFSLGTNAATYQQARARIYRAGQTRKCVYYHLTCGSVDHRLREIMEGKVELQEVMNGGKIF